MDNKQLLHNMLLIRDYNPSLRENLFNKLYPFSNENLGGYMSKVDLYDSTVLTTGSGTEQVFNLAYYGAKNIKVYDINPFVKYHFALKLAALKELNDKEYLKFFHTDLRKRKLNHKYYERLRKYLDNESLEFWDLAYSLYLEDNPLLLFKNDEISKRELLEYNPYLKNKFKTIDRIEKTNIDFQKRNILSIEDEKFDYMFLSNILDYVDSVSMRKYDFSVDRELLNERIDAYMELVLKLGTNLNDNGMLFYHYFWDITNDMLDLYRALVVKFAGLEEFKFMRFGNRRMPDGVGIYTKRK